MSPAKPPAKKYVRVYYEVIDDPRFASVYDDDIALATWLRLLLLADAMYPAPAPIPYGTSDQALEVLVAAGIVELSAGGRFLIHGLASERERRSRSARIAAGVRWESDGIETPDAPAMRTHDEGIPDPDADPMPRRAETSKAEQSKAETKPSTDKTSPTRAAREVRPAAADPDWQPMTGLAQLAPEAIASIDAAFERPMTDLFDGVDIDPDSFMGRKLAEKKAAVQ